MRDLSCRFAVVALLALAGGCTWVDLSAQAREVAVINAEQAEQCKPVGKTTARTLDKVAFVSRSREKLAAELASLARNDAADMGGNAIVAETDIEDGVRRYSVYLCPQR